jgi:hypothetical protein
MGLLLVLTGLGLLLGQFYKVAVLNFSLKWWPVLFILLGVEVLLQNQFRKDEQSKLKYDIFSIIIILSIVLTGLCLQSLTQLGLVERARTTISSQVFTVQNSAEIPLEAGIQKIVLTTGGNQVSIHSSPGNSIIADSTFQIRAQSQLEAQGTADESNKISQQRAVNTLYIELQPNHGSNPVVDCSYALIIPEQVSVEIDGADSRLNINLDSIQSNWEITGSGVCDIKLPTGSDVLVNAWLNNDTSLYGNLVWTKSKIGLDADKSVNNAESSAENQIQAQSKLGNGTHKMSILGMNELTINYLP